MDNNTKQIDIRNESKINGNENWRFDWTDILNQSYDFSFFELQFANCKRLEYNDDIYIFDEVGTGKTISSGLMALHYIYNKYKWEKAYKDILGHKRLVNDEQKVIRGGEVDTDVLVITVNAVTDQFKNDWSKTLNFNERTIESEVGKKVFKDFNPYRNGRVMFINNIVRKDENDEFVHFNSDKKIGLLIVDEAHLFVKDNTDTNLDDENSNRFNALKKLNAEKIIFLTATPNRYDKSNLDKYVEIASEILNKDNAKIDIGKRITNIKECFGLEVEDESDLICCKLNFKMCATRYFKDTIRKIQNKSFEKIKAKRWIPEIWENPLNKVVVNNNSVFIQKFYNTIQSIRYDYYKKYNYPFNDSIFNVLNNICDIRNNNNKNNQLKDKFLIFIDRIDDGQSVINDHIDFINKELSKDFFDIKFCEYDNQRNNKNDKVLTYKIVNSDTYEKAQDFSKSENVPDILIVISKAVEQGVNLPAYSYIINFDVNKSVAALEQRFGRIDRINDTKYTEIHTVYVLDYRRKNQDNFITAMNNYRDMLEGEFTIPSKNVVINETTLNYFAADSMVELHIKSLEEQKNIINLKKDSIIQGFSSSELNIPTDKYNYIFELNNELEKLSQQSNNVYNRKIIVDYTLKEISKELKDLDKIKQIRNCFEVDGNKDILDSIFYSKQHKLATIKGIDCAKYILNEGAEQMEELRKLNPARHFFDNNEDLVKRIEKELEYYFLFKNNNPKEDLFELVPTDVDGVETIRIVKFAVDEYSRNSGDLEKITQAIIYKNYEELPLFKLIDIIKNSIEKHRNDNNYSLISLKKFIFNEINDFELISDEFKDLVLNDKDKYWELKKNDLGVYTSPFLKTIFNILFKSRNEYLVLFNIIKIIKNDVDELDYYYYSQSNTMPYYNNGMSTNYKKDYGDMENYIKSTKFMNDVDLAKKIFKDLFDISNEYKFLDWESKILYYYVKYDYESLKKAFLFNELNLTLPYKVYRAKDISRNNTKESKEFRFDICLI